MAGLVVLASCGEASSAPVDAAVEPDAAQVCDSACTWSCTADGCDPAVAIAAGAFHACALRRSGRVDCWGGNLAGQVGSDSSTEVHRPTPVPGLENVAQLAAGDLHTCVLLRDEGTTLCWGANDRGQLGDGTFVGRAMPGPVTVQGDTFYLRAGGNTTCSSRFGVECWGSGNEGQLGTGQTADSPIAHMMSGASAAPLDVGQNHACLLDAGAVQCWGRANWGQLGDGVAAHGDCDTDTDATVDCALTPVTATFTISPIATLHAGADVTCVTDAAGHAQCVGWNGAGQLGDGAASHALCGLDDCARTPVDVAGVSGVVEVASVPGVTCFLSGDGHVRCAGSSDRGMLGDGAASHGACPPGRNTGRDCATSPVEVAGLDDAIHIAGGGGAFFAIRAEGSVVAWGANDMGGLGDGTTSERHTPIAVLRPDP